MRQVTRRCHATARSGKPCGMAALKDSRFCWSHDPDTKAAHKAHATLGGVRRQQGASAGATAEEDIPAADLKSIDGGIAALERIYESLRRSPSNRALARARALTAVVSEAIRCHRDYEFDKRLAALEGQDVAA